MISNLSLSQMCGQLIVGGYLGHEPSEGIRRRIAEGTVAGTIVFRRNLPDLQAAHATCFELSRAGFRGLCPFVSIDQEGGRVERLPAPALSVPPMGRLGALGDRQLIRRVARSVGQQLRAIGFNLNFAPVLDIHTNAANPVIGDRAFGSDVLTVCELGSLYAKTLQQEGVMACGKHFPGHGDTSTDSHVGLPVVHTSVEHMFDVELRPFEAAIDAGIDAIMTAHIICSQISLTSPATLEPTIITGLLRERLHFDGLVFSDDLEMGAIAGTWSIPDAAVAAIRAGCDVVLICKTESAQTQAHEALVREAERDAAFRRRCETAALRSMQARERKPSRPRPRFEEVLEVVRSHACVELADELARRVP